MSADSPDGRPVVTDDGPAERAIRSGGPDDGPVRLHGDTRGGLTKWLEGVRAGEIPGGPL